MKRMVKKAGDLDNLADVIQEDESGVIIGKNLIVEGTITSSGGSSERELTLTMPYARNTSASDKNIEVDEETWNKIKDCYYETIKINYNDGYTLGVFHVFYYNDYSSNLDAKQYACVGYPDSRLKQTDWYGNYQTGWFAKIDTTFSGSRKLVWVHQFVPYNVPNLDKSKFDALYKLADKPTGDGTYVLKATVSSGAVTYTWVAE